MSDYIPVIGLEIHVELQTKSKMFCQCSADYFGKEPNSQVCPVCLGLPGALPVPNKKAIEYCQLIGLALGCKLNKTSKFDRKHYFYPDLPKGYQISQYDEPFCKKGEVTIYNPKSLDEVKHEITRVHMEEDTGKLIHKAEESLVDFNRSGVPLVEIVTEPDFDNAEDVKAFLKELQLIIRDLDVSNADMEKGSMRLEPNISLRLRTEKQLPAYKVEVKNINSFNFVKKAIECEIERQTEILKNGDVPEQETRGFNENKGITFSQRSKEYAHDYRYFPEPDIPPLEFDQTYFKKLENSLPELPRKRWQRFIKLGLSQSDAFLLAFDPTLTEKFEQLLSLGDAQNIAKIIINKKTLSLDQVKELIKKSQMPIKTDEKRLDAAIKLIMVQDVKAVEDYKRGKENALMFLVGQVMKEIKGQVDVNAVKQKLLEKLK